MDEEDDDDDDEDGLEDDDDSEGEVGLDYLQKEHLSVSVVQNRTENNKLIKTILTSIFKSLCHPWKVLEFKLPFST